MSEHEDIEHLKGLEAIRRRPGMYVGSTENCDVLLREVVDNCIDEAYNSKCNSVSIEKTKEGYYVVKDNGRGIPTRPSKDNPNMTQCRLAFSTLHSGSKFNKTGIEAGCFTEDTEILVTDDCVNYKSITFKELIDSDKKLYTLVQDAEGNVKPSLIKWAQKTKTVEKVISLELENGKTIECSEDHKFILNDGSIKHANELTENDELMDFNLRFKLRDVFDEKINVQGPFLYGIHNIVENKWYIGSTKYDLQYRFCHGARNCDHRYRTMNHDKRKLYKYLTPETIDIFEVEILEFNPVSPDRESYFIQKYNSTNKGGYNTFKSGKGCLEDKKLIKVYNNKRSINIDEKNLDSYLAQGYSRGVRITDKNKAGSESHKKQSKTLFERNVSFGNREVQKELAKRGSLKSVETNRLKGTFQDSSEQSRRAKLGQFNQYSEIIKILHFLNLEINEYNYKYIRSIMYKYKKISTTSNFYKFDYKVIDLSEGEWSLNYIDYLQKRGLDYNNEENWNKFRSENNQPYYDRIITWRPYLFKGEIYENIKNKYSK